MLFSSPFFIFIFLPIFFTSFILCKPTYRDYVLLTASIGFYFWSEPIFCLIALLSTQLDHWLCKKIHQLGINNKKAKRYVALGIIINLLILFYYKYTNFFLTSISELVYQSKYHFDLLNIILPIGVSFIVFEKITYIVDVFRGTGKPADNILKYINYVFLFPKLLAGPIIKYHEIEKQLHERHINSNQIAEGFKRFLLGLAKKVFIADTCGSIANQVFALSNTQLSFGYAWLGIACFTLQIYFDFSGYSDMALGLARTLGFELRENFNMPYISKSFTEFWRRWHISLSTWIREYLYIPLGGSRSSRARVYVNLWICFLLSGLWHGANWTFVLWGAYNGFFLVLDKLILQKISVFMPSILRISVTLFLIMLGWVIFRSNDFHQIGYYFNALFNVNNRGNAYIDVTNDIVAIMLLGFMIVLLPLMPRYTHFSTQYLAWKGRITTEGILFGILGFLAICKVVGSTYSPFLYFKF